MFVFYLPTSFEFEFFSISSVPWYPTKNTRICSSHFLGGKKSNDPRKEAYNPTVFPWKKENPMARARVTRLEKRRKNAEKQPNTIMKMVCRFFLYIFLK